jgi:hypothetical protein
MNAQRDVELMLRAHFEISADRTVPDGQVEGILGTTAGRRQQPVWLASLRSHPMTTTARSFGRLRFTPAWALLLILALLIAVVAVGLTVGGVPFQPSPIVNGPIAFGRYNAALGDTVINVTRPDGSGTFVLSGGTNECPQFSPTAGASRSTSRRSRSTVPTGDRSRRPLTGCGWAALLGRRTDGSWLPRPGTMPITPSAASSS